MSGARSTRALPWVLAVALVASVPTAFAQSPAEAPIEDRSSNAPAVPGLVVIFEGHVNSQRSAGQGGVAGLDPYRVRRAIEDELGVPVLSAPDERAAGTLTVHVLDETNLEMIYAGKDGRRNSRTVKLPTDPQKRIETVALVAGNLARDETGQLIEELRPPVPPEPPAAPADAEGPPVPAATGDDSAEPTEPRPKPQSPRPPKREADAEKGPGDAGEQQDEALQPLVDAPLNLSFFHPLALYRDSEKRRFAIDLGFVYSRVGAIDGFGMTLLVSRVDRELSGVQMAAIGTLVGGDLEGASLSGLFSHHTGDASGVVASGVWSYSSGALRGARLAGVAAWQRGALTGFQGSGVANLTGPVRGATLAGVSNVVQGPVEGGQLAGVVNVARGALDGGQIAGVVNVAEDVDGFQIGLVNIGRRVRGFQLGLVNVADEVDGASIALAPIVKDGEQRLVFWTAPGHAIVNLGAKFENGPVYSLIGIGYEPEELSNFGGGSGRYYPTVALGAHVGMGPAFAELDVQYQSAQRIEDGSDQHHAVALRPKLGWQPFESFGVFAGLAAEHRVTGAENLNLRGFAGFQLF